MELRRITNNDDGDGKEAEEHWVANIKHLNEECIPKLLEKTVYLNPNLHEAPYHRDVYETYKIVVAIVQQHPKLR